MNVTGPIRRVSVVSTGQVQIRPDHVVSTWRPTVWWLLASQSWTGPRPGPDGATTQAWLQTGEAYAFTAAASIRAVEETLTRSLRGAFSPAAAFGADFALTIPDTTRTDTITAEAAAGRRKDQEADMPDRQFLARTRYRAPAQISSQLSASIQHQLAATTGRLVPAGEADG